MTSNVSRWRWWWLRPQFRDEPQNLLEHLPCDGDLGHLEDDRRRRGGCGNSRKLASFAWNDREGVQRGWELSHDHENGNRRLCECRWAWHESEARNGTKRLAARAAPELPRRSHRHQSPILLR